MSSMGFIVVGLLAVRSRIAKGHLATPDFSNVGIGGWWGRRPGQDHVNVRRWQEKKIDCKPLI